MGDGVTPRCLACGEPVELDAHLEHLNAHQGLIEWYQGILPEARFAVMPWCEECRRNPERKWLLVADLSDEELRERLKGLVERTGPEAHP